MHAARPYSSYNALACGQRRMSACACVHVCVHVCVCVQVVDTAKLVGKCVTAANEHAAAATAPAARSAPRIVRAGASGARPPQPSQPPLQAEPSEPLVLCSDAVMILCYLPPDRHYMGHSAHVADPLLGESSKLLVSTGVYHYYTALQHSTMVRWNTPSYW